jgi:hypothetical protein
MNPEETSAAIIEAEKEKVKFYEGFGGISGVLDTSDSENLVVLVEDRTYPVFATKNALKQHQPGVVQNFNVHLGYIRDELGFVLLCVKEKARTTYNLKGCWETRRGLPKFMVYRNIVPSRHARAVLLTLVWDDAPVADGQYWEIVAELIGDSFAVLQALGPFDPPQKYQKRVEKTFKNPKSDAPPPVLKSARTSRAIDPPQSEPIIETASEPIAFNASTAIEETTSTTEATEVIEPITASEIKAIVESPSKSIKPEEPEASPVVAEPVTPKTKKASGKSSASKKLSIAPETVEPKKTKEKVKASSSKKPMSLAADRLFLGKQLPPGK